jgi:hypothetical protein
MRGTSLAAMPPKGDLPALRRGDWSEALGLLARFWVGVAWEDSARTHGLSGGAGPGARAAPEGGSAAHRGRGQKSEAEKEGFEPSRQGFSPPNALAGRRLQPLGHFSGRGQDSRATRLTFPYAGGVAERSNAAVSKTVRGGFVPRGFKSLPLRLSPRRSHDSRRLSEGASVPRLSHRRACRSGPGTDVPDRGRSWLHALYAGAR